jgi:hypothetical protein
MLVAVTVPVAMTAVPSASNPSFSVSMAVTATLVVDDLEGWLLGVLPRPLGLFGATTIIANNCGKTSPHPDIISK